LRRRATPSSAPSSRASRVAERRGTLYPLRADVILSRVAMLSLSTNALKTTPRASFARATTRRCVAARARAPARGDRDAVSLETRAEDAKKMLAVATPALATTLAAGAAHAAVDPVASAFAAYGHYLGLVLVVGALTTEKWTVKAGMSEAEEQRLVVADSIYGIAGVLVLYTGYLRATEYGKGWEFYSHEPIFWVKMWLFTVMGSSSLFPTIKIIGRAAAKAKGEVEPMSEKLATRITKIVNGELLAVCSIPLAAALMSRGVAYAPDMPWQAGAAPIALTSLGLGVKYVKEALTWEED
jgi:uncharacterized membrane protein